MCIDDYVSNQRKHILFGVVEWLAWLTCHGGAVAKLDDAGSNPVHKDGQFRTNVWSPLHCVSSLSKTAYFHCSVHMTSAVDTDVKLNHSLRN